MAEIVELLAAHGAAVVLVFAFLEQIGAPVPAIPVLIVAGAVAATSGSSLELRRAQMGCDRKGFERSNPGGTRCRRL
ncbi:MAG TPA: hypothetical protein VM557_07400 [Thermoanaerobaculia bacterium]|nr:hypothetical protein [Thermoanaerobaculia bacterium]